MSVADLDNILYRLAVTEDARLEQVIGVLLPRLLAHLTAEATPARAKVRATHALDSTVSCRNAVSHARMCRTGC